MKKAGITLFFFWVIIFQFKAQTFSIKGNVSLEGEKENVKIEAFLSERGEMKTLKNGQFKFDSLYPGNFTITLFASGYTTLKKSVEISNSDLLLEFKMKPLSKEIKAVSINETRDNDFGISRLKPVEGTAVYAGKKSEVIQVDDLSANLATNNSRQIYSKVAGLNIWENDGAGIQLAIGGRGLNPNRVSNFNTRQNGYDISADALGYPESYYSPPAEAIERVEIVRGAASLQYGTQFGGIINFKLKDGPEDKKLELNSRQTVGSYGLFSSFNSVGGSKGKWQYYGFYQYKRGDGWRENSEFDVHTAHTNVSYQFSTKLKLGFEYTFMHYLAHQAGGLTDAMFEKDAQQSIRERNWFQVDWNLAALTLDYELSDRTDFNFRGFGLLAGRDAVGNLGYITRIDDPESERDLLSDDYKNWGVENRLLHRYDLFDNTTIFLIGMRYYQGFTERNQGAGTADADADFSFENPQMPDDSKYDFPSRNLAFFTENVFYLSPKFSVTPGLRFEYIRTASDGYYINRSTNLAGEIIQETTIEDERNSERSFLLGGIGLSYKPDESFETYANFSQNYRSINFNDMRIVNPNYQVDTNLTDENGFSADLGIRGNKKNWFNYDISVFLMQYRDRIGNVRITDEKLFRPIRFRTNVSDSRTIGLESFIEFNLLAPFGLEESNSRLSVFSNFSIMQAEYVNSEETAFEGKEVELVPPIIFRGGLTYAYNSFQLSFLYSYTEEHYTDATNSDFSSNAVNGIIPSYEVVDFSVKYKYKQWTAESGINNLLDETYFSRRAAGYPGPGIIPAEPRTYYFTLGLTI